ncbi:hypothetical protein AB0945_19220 [Streptomyces sp. NPDC005474]|uniref:hypothetical protein n=1 Tax=Streptomyces sp. NPDC005474 TaxID=3154878 RepID=UPI003453DDCD
MELALVAPLLVLLGVGRRGPPLGHLRLSLALMLALMLVLTLMLALALALTLTLMLVLVLVHVRAPRLAPGLTAGRVRGRGLRRDGNRPDAAAPRHTRQQRFATVGGQHDAFARHARRGLLALSTLRHQDSY